MNASRQLLLDGSLCEPEEKPRAGCIGKVQRFINERPWLTVGEIATEIGEPSSRVSETLNKLKHEGRAQSKEGLGVRDRFVWAGTSEKSAAARDAGLRRAEREASDRSLERLAKKAGIETEDIDWRPNETIAEDLCT